MKKMFKVRRRAMMKLLLYVIFSALSGFLIIFITFLLKNSRILGMKNSGLKKSKTLEAYHSLIKLKIKRRSDIRDKTVPQGTAMRMSNKKSDWRYFSAIVLRSVMNTVSLTCTALKNLRPISIAKTQLNSNN